MIFAIVLSFFSCCLGSVPEFHQSSDGSKVINSILRHFVFKDTLAKNTANYIDDLRSSKNPILTPDIWDTLCECQDIEANDFVMSETVDSVEALLNSAFPELAMIDNVSNGERKWTIIASTSYPLEYLQLPLTKNSGLLIRSDLLHKWAMYFPQETKWNILKTASRQHALKTSFQTLDGIQEENFKQILTTISSISLLVPNMFKESKETLFSKILAKVDNDLVNEFIALYPEAVNFLQVWDAVTLTNIESRSKSTKTNILIRMLPLKTADEHPHSILHDRLHDEKDVEEAIDGLLFPDIAILLTCKQQHLPTNIRSHRLFKKSFANAYQIVIYTTITPIVNSTIPSLSVSSSIPQIKELFEHKHIQNKETNSKVNVLKGKMSFSSIFKRQSLLKK